MTSRKDRDFNPGVPLQQKLPPAPYYPTTPGQYPMAMPERVLLRLLVSEIARFSDLANADYLRAFFEHYYGDVLDPKDIASYIVSFQQRPPQAVLGYPRVSVDWPCYAIILESDVQDLEALSQYLGQTQPGDPARNAREYLGSMFKKALGIYVFAENPDQCLYLYHFAKGLIMGAAEVLAQYGLVDPQLDGADLGPNENLLPRNAFVRKLLVTVQTLETVPRVFTVDGRDARLGPIFATDTWVGGMQGGVAVTEIEDGQDNGDDDA